MKTKAFDEIVFGTKERRGRVLTGVEEAVRKQASFVLWGGGSSQTSDGTIEADYIFTEAVGTKLFDLAAHVRRESKELSKYLKEVSFRDTLSMNTVGEIQTAVNECQRRGIRELTLVSSPTHIARCFQESCILKEQHPDLPITFYARASQTCFIDSTAADVTIFEPPHREDRPKIYFNRTTKQIVPILLSGNEEVATAFDQELAQLIQKYKDKL